jgi:hypothetical protein
MEDSLIMEKSEMEKSKIFNEGLLRFPLTYEKEKGFKESSILWIEGYITLLKRYAFDPDIVTKVCSFKEKYKMMLELYYQGKHSKAYACFEDAITKLIPGIDLLLQKVTDTDYFRTRIVPVEQMDICYEKREMWHIPFDKRELVKTERYSFPGVPCLYMGASSYACWVELNRPKFNAIQVAYIKPKEKAKSSYFLDISMLPIRFKKLIDENNDVRYSVNDYALICPIVALCSVKVCNESDWFKPEYIFPQFFMEYILDKGDEKRIIGIKYASVKTTTKHQYERDEWELYTCYVVPAISIHDKAIEGDDSMELFGIENTISAVEQELLSYGLSSTNGGAIEIERKKIRIK